MLFEDFEIIWYRIWWSIRVDVEISDNFLKKSLILFGIGFEVFQFILRSLMFVSWKIGIGILGIGFETYHWLKLFGVLRLFGIGFDFRHINDSSFLEILILFVIEFDEAFGFLLRSLDNFFLEKFEIIWHWTWVHIEISDVFILAKFETLFKISSHYKSLDLLSNGSQRNVWDITEISFAVVFSQGHF